MFEPAGFLDDETGALESQRLALVGGMVLIAGILTFELFGASIAARFSAHDPGVEAFSAELGMIPAPGASR